MRLAAVLAAITLTAGPATAGSADRRLDIYWVDVEGGAATLLVTPAGESILVDTGYPGPRDAGRIHKVATEAGLKKIDHVIVTHYHVDHFGGLADLAKLIPVGTLYERDLASAPETERRDERLAPYKQVAVDKRVTVKPGDTLSLVQAKDAAPLAFRFLGANQSFVAARPAVPNAEVCKQAAAKDADTSDNKNSLVMLATFGPFRFFDGGDLTWNTEQELVCPEDKVGAVDVFQSEHHGLDRSNNPVLVRTLAPTVTIVNNGPRKGGEPGTFALLRSLPSLKAIYQVHRNVRVGADQNTAPELTANSDEECKGNHVKLSVDPKGTTYVVTVPATGHEKKYDTRGK